MLRALAVGYVCVMVIMALLLITGCSLSTKPTDRKWEAMFDTALIQPSYNQPKMLVK